MRHTQVSVSYLQVYLFKVGGFNHGKAVAHKIKFSLEKPYHSFSTPPQILLSRDTCSMNNGVTVAYSSFPPTHLNVSASQAGT